MRFNTYLTEGTPQDIKSFESKWKSKLMSLGVTNFEFSNHAGKLRLNDRRNNPPITFEELDFVMDGFIRKMGSQLRKDIDNVKNNIAKKRGIKKEAIPRNNLEFTIKSVKTKINFVIVLKQDRKTKGTAMILPITVQRKKGWKTTKGEEIVVERKEIDKMKFQEYLSEAIKWKKVDDKTQDMFNGEAVSMTRYDGYDLTILKKDGKWIPVHGVIQMKPMRNEKQAQKILIQYVDKLPDSSKIKGAN